MLKVSEKFYERCALAILLLTVALVLITFRQYGITWDEEYQSQYGQAVVNYYMTFFKDRQYDEIFNLYLYGGMFDGFASLIDRFTPFSVYETRHLVNALFGVLGLWGAWRLGRFIGGGATGLLALIFLVLTPSYYGHMFNNPKDIPFAVGIIWSIYFMARCYSEWPRPKKSLLAKLTIVLGLTLGVRVGGVMILAFWAAALGLEVITRFFVTHATAGIHFKKKMDARLRGHDAVVLAFQLFYKMFLPVLIGAYAVMLICWPWAQQHPIGNPLRAISEFSNFPQDVEVLLDGTIYRSTQLPWTYVPVYFGIQTPELILVLLFGFFALLPWIWRKLGASQRHAVTIILMMGLVPILYAMIRHPALYDAVRHFLFVVPLICILAAVSGRFIFVWATGAVRNKAQRRILAGGMFAVVVLFAAIQIFLMHRLHPYEYIYANRLTGGVAGAYGKYELDYWGSSFKEAVQELQDFVAREGGIPEGKIYRIAICGPWDAAMIYLPPDYEPVVANEPAEFFLSTTRWMCQNMRPGKEIIRIKRVGAPLSIVKDLRGVPSPKSTPGPAR